MPVTEIPGLVTFAMFNDPDGLLVESSRAQGRRRASRPSSQATEHPSTGSRS